MSSRPELSIVVDRRNWLRVGLHCSAYLLHCNSLLWKMYPKAYMHLRIVVY